MGTPSARRRASALAIVVGLLAALLAALGPAAPAQAANGTVRGQVINPQGGKVNLKMLWFSKDWRYLGERRVTSDIYSLSLPPGTYHLQFVDQRPAYDVTKYAPADVTVRLGSGQRVQKDVRLRRGAAITGTVRAGGRAAAGARVVAANTFEQSYETKANSKGQFAIGGLPSSSYSVWGYDRQAQFVGPSVYLRGLKRGKVANTKVVLGKRGGSLLVDLQKPDGSRMGGSFFVTVSSKRTGQFWTAKAKRGTVTFQGLHPGKYVMDAPGVGIWLARRGNVSGAFVKAGRADLASTFRWTKRGAWVTGTVVDESEPDVVLPGAQVMLFDRSGTKVATTTTDGAGRFTLSGAILTQRGMTVVASAGPYTDFLGPDDAGKCRFGRTEVGGVSVVTSEQTDVGDVLLPRKPGQSGACAA